MGRVWCEVRAPDGGRLNVNPIGTVINLVYRLELDRVGTFTAAFPATTEAVAAVTPGRQLWFSVEGEGVVFKGVAEQIAFAQDGDVRTLQVAGGSIAKALAWKTTLVGFQLNAATLSSAVASLLSGTGWSAGTLASPSTTITARFDGRSIWQALVDVGDVFGLSVREDHLSAGGPFVDVAAFGGTPTLLLANVPEVTPELSAANTTLAITRISERVEALELVNRVVPLGQMTGLQGASAWLTLQHSTRTSPYTIQSATGPDGKPYYYIRDASSEATYGVRERVLQVRDITPLGTSTTDRERAANTLYDEAAAWLADHSQPLTVYTVDVAGMRHCVDGAPQFEVGDAVRILYRGVVQGDSGAETVRAIDTAATYLVSAERRLSASEDTWQLVVATRRKGLPNDGNVTERFIEDLQAVRGTPLPFVLFGDNTMRISSQGHELRTPPDSGTIGSMERKIRWTRDDAFADTVGQIWVGHNEALNATYATFAARQSTDTFVRMGSMDMTSGAWRHWFQVSNQGVAPWNFEWGTYRGGTLYEPILACRYDMVAHTTVIGRWENGSWVESPLGGVMKVANEGYELLPAGPSNGTPVSCGGGAWGSWTELRSATGPEICIVGVAITIQDQNLVRTWVQLDIGTGASGSEVSRAGVRSSYAHNVSDDTATPTNVWFPYPVVIPASTRIAVRGAASTGVVVAVTLYYVRKANLVPL